jgi:predicted outer membrane protein
MGAISDSAIIAMLQLSNTEEVAAADLALTKASSDRVKRYADELKRDHSKALQDLQTYAQKMANSGAGSSGMASGMAGNARVGSDSANTGRSSSSMPVRHDSSAMTMSGQRDSASMSSSMHRDSSMTGRDNSAMSGQRDSASTSRMTQNDLPPGADTAKSRTYPDSADHAMRRDSSVRVGATGVNGSTGLPGSVSSTPGTNNPNNQAAVSGQSGMGQTSAQGDLNLASIQSLSGHEFDHGFVRLQVEHHQEEINHLRNDVIPMIKDSGLRNLVQGMLPVMGRHLREGRDLEGYLKTVQ